MVRRLKINITILVRRGHFQTRNVSFIRKRTKILQRKTVIILHVLLVLGIRERVKCSECQG